MHALWRKWNAYLRSGLNEKSKMRSRKLLAIVTMKMLIVGFIEKDLDLIDNNADFSDHVVDFLVIMF